RRRAAAAGVDAVGLQVAGVDAEPGVAVADVQARAGLAQAVAAGARVRAHAGMRTIRATAAGEHLDHAADGLAAVQARARAAHDLDALDQFQRQILERRQAGSRDRKSTRLNSSHVKISYA